MVGKKLRKARENRGITIEEVHDQTKIHPHVIEALEEDRLENSLGTAYVKAFLRSYAGYLGLDVQQIMKEYTSTMKPEYSSQAVVKDVSAKNALREKRNMRNVAVAFVAILAWVIAVILVTGRFVVTYKTFTGKKKVTVSGSADRSSGKTTTGTSLEQIPKGVPSLKPARDTILPPQENFIPIPKRRTIVLTLTSRRDVWLKVLQDGEVAFHGTLSKGSQETWRASEEIRLLEIGRPRALKFNINGEDIDIAGSRVGRKLIIKREGVYLEPR